MALPYVDSSIKIQGYALKHLLYGAPGGFVFFFGIFSSPFTSGSGLFWTTAAIGIPLALIGILISATTDYETTTGLDRARAGLRSVVLRWQYPRDHVESSIEPIHGVKRIFANGFAEMEDGRYVAIVRVDGRHTERQSPSAANEMVKDLTLAIRREMDGPFDFFMTTFDTDVDEITDKYREQYHSDRFGGDEWVIARELLRDYVQFEKEEAEGWDARDLRSYIVVEVDPFDLDDRFQENDGSLFSLRSGGSSNVRQRKQMRRRLRDRVASAKAVAGSVSGCSGELIGPAEHAVLLAKYWAGVEHRAFSDESASQTANLSVWPDIKSAESGAHEHEQAKKESHRPGAVDAHLDEQARTNVEATTAEEDLGEEADGQLSLDAVAGIDEVEVAGDGGATGVEPTDSVVTQLLQSPAEAGPAEDVIDDSETASETTTLARIREGLFHPLGNSETDGDRGVDSSPLQDALSPRTVDVHDDYVEVGDQYARTYWLTGWRKRPPSNIFKALQTLGGVDFDFRIRARPVDKADAIERLKPRIQDIDADISDRQEVDDIESSVMTEDVHYYQAMYRLLKQTTVRPFELNGYLTVRAGSKRALDLAEEQIEQGYESPETLTLDVAKRRALEEAEEPVLNAVEDTPAELSAISSSRADELFKSGAPGARDQYNEQSWKDHYTMVCDGALGALFPFARSNVQDEDGVEYGRSEHHGQKIVASQFERGGAGHKLTLADSGSGKTYHAGKQALRWWLGEEDRTVVLLDTMGDFYQHTEAVNGNRIVVDGNTTINPLLIQETPETVMATKDVDPFGMARDSAVRWVLSIIKAQGGDPDDFKHLVSEIVTETYREAGIYPGQPETHGRESPTMDDFIEQTTAMLENPTEYTLSGHNIEGEEVKQEVRQFLRKLVGFKKHGRYQHLIGESEVTLEEGEVNYLDLQQIEALGTADKSTMLQLLLRNVYEMVKRAPGETIFVIDEAHYLLHSEEMLPWLQQAARHWRHYDAGLWFLSHRADEFISGNDDEAGHKDAIRGQCTTTEFFRLKDLDRSVADAFGLNESQYNFVTSEAVTGEADVGYTTGIVGFSDEQEWYTFRVSSGNFEDALLSYDPETHGAFHHYMRAHVSDTEALDRAFGISGPDANSDEQVADEGEETVSQSSDARADESKDEEGGEAEGEHDTKDTSDGPGPLESALAAIHEERDQKDTTAKTDSEANNEARAERADSDTTDVDDEAEEDTRAEDKVGDDEDQEAEPAESEEEWDDEATEDDSEDVVEEAPEKEADIEDESQVVTTITGIGESYSSQLREAGIETVDDLAAADRESLEEQTLIASTLLEKWIDAARERSNTDSDDQSISSASSSDEAEAVEGVSDDD
ncbi:helix-hairpin-helix domain-containing protein [Saliphagus sp. LR7]|uniref:helix-hairpin-helix domain-containing protein n=1 Tax=Saliphagus sp. LR7 TaxID=2282654 RepID=UPI0013002732|nr:helix-hairpin-helix domain-containing protein [Saliphagus sp. LR7]